MYLIYTVEVNMGKYLITKCPRYQRYLVFGVHKLADYVQWMNCF